MRATIAGQVRRLRQAVRSGPQPHPDLVTLTPEDRRYLTSLFDDTVPLPAGAEEELREDNPRLAELRAAYAALDLPALVQSRWRREAVRSFLDLRYFRGETLITWHYRELPRITMLKYFIYARYVRDRAAPALLESLREDGAFGCWTYTYPGYGTFSRDLLDSLNEISFLERMLQLSSRDRFTVLDIGAGYGRLAHRMAEGYPNLADYCCVDAVPEATFLSEYYLRYRRAMPPVRVVSLDQVQWALEPGSFDLALNVHGFSECTYAAVDWWLGELRRLRVPRLLLIPNEPTEMLTLEVDGAKRDFAPLLAEHGYRLDHVEPVIEDQAIRELVRVHDRFHLFSLAG